MALTGTDANDVFSLTVSRGIHTVDGRGGTDLLTVDLSGMAGSVDTTHSGGILGNGLPTDNPDRLVLGVSGVESMAITTGGGDDYLYLFAGNDTVFAGAGDDTIYTRLGSAVVDGGAGTDLWVADLRASNVASTLDLASPLTQPFHGGSVTAIERINLMLGNGNDTILTLTGARGVGLRDDIYAGGGNDTVRIGNGEDLVNGGDGDDLAIIDYAHIAGDLKTTHSGGIISNGLTGDARVTAFLNNVERVNITAGAGDDALYLFNGNDTVSTGAGDDIINTRKGAAVVNGGDGRDHWIADLSVAKAAGVLDLALARTQAFLGGSVKGIESVELMLGSGNDRIVTLTGTRGRGTDDVIDGGAGNDTITIGGGRDTARGGAGDDLLRIDYATAKGSFTTTHSGGIVSNGLTGDDRATAYISGFERIDITTGKGNDHLFTGAGADTLNGGAGSDTMYGGNGGDLYHVDSSKDVVVERAGQGTDTVLARTTYTLTANVENLTLAGTGKIAAYGNELANSIIGNSAGNIIDGGAGKDVMTGGKGGDRFVFQPGDTGSTKETADRITDFTRSQSDRIDLKAIDAITGGEDNAFTFIGKTAFSDTAGELRAFVERGNTYLAGDTDGNGRADVVIRLDGTHMLTPTDFIL